MILRSVVRALQRQWIPACIAAGSVLLLGLVFGPRLSPSTAQARLVLVPATWSPTRATDFVQGAAVLDQAARSLGYDDSRWIRRDLVARPGDGAVQLSFTASGAGRAVETLNAVGKAFEALASSTQRDEIETESRRLDALLGARRADLDAVSPARRRIETLTGLIETARSEAALDAARIEQLRKTIERNDAGPVQPISTTESDRLALEADLAARRLKELRTQYPEDWPPVVRAAEELQALKERHAAQQNREILEAKFAPVRAGIEEIRRLTERRERRLAELPVLEEEHRGLRAVVPAASPGAEAMSAALKELEHRRTILDLSRAPGDAVVRRFETAAVAGGSSAPLGALAALALLSGVLAAWGREALGTTLRTEHDVRRYVNLPLLAVVPVSEPEDRTLPGAGQAVTEAYNTLAALVETRTKEDGARLFALTSASPSEGKSTASCNLAVALARAGSRVLLVDADLRRGTQHKLFAVANDPGLSSYLQGGTDTVDSMICATDVDNLTLLPSGAPMQNPIPFLHSERFNALLRDLRGWYEYVILDLPPVRSAADALVVSPLADAVVLVAAAAQTRKDDIAYAKRMLRSVKARICGCVLTKAKIQGGGYYYYPSTVAADAAD